MLKVLVLPLKDNVDLPEYQSEYSSGMDVRSNNEEEIIIEPGKWKLIPTDISVSIPKGYEIQIRSRSGLSYKHGIFVLNGIGTIDSDYRGPIGVLLGNFGDVVFVVKPKMRIAQIVLSKVERIKWEVVSNLDKTSRGSGGFGSTGKK